MKTETKKHQVGTIFSVLNEKEAEFYIERMVEFCDNSDYRQNKPWKKDLFKGLRRKGSEYPFGSKADYYHLMRLIPESLEDPKPKVDPGLIAALRLSIQQWQIMCDTGKDKREVYLFLGGIEENSCFLCNFVGVSRCGGKVACQRCINWKADFCHSSNNSPFRAYQNNPESKSARLCVLSHLKSELERLESEYNKTK